MAKKEVQEKKQQKQKKQKEVKKQFKIKSWYSNRYQIVSVQRNILLIFAAFSVISMSFAVMFVKHISASKSLEPYVIEVEEKSGIATVVDQMDSNSFTENEIIKKYFINQYLQASTSYDARYYKANLEIVRLFSTASVYKQFRNRVNPKRLGVDSRIDVSIKSIKFPTPTTVQIRILREINVKGGDISKNNEVINMSFYFTTNMKLTAEERFVNPLGFQVNSYSITEEILEY